MGDTKFTATCWCSKLMLIITMRTSWMRNRTIPDSIITNKTCRSFWPPRLDECNEPKVSSPPDIALTSKNTLRILNTIKPVTRVFTAMDAAKLVAITGGPQAAFWNPATLSNVVEASEPNQVARGNRMKSAYQTKTDRLTCEYDYKE